MATVDRLLQALHKDEKVIQQNAMPQTHKQPKDEISKNQIEFGNRMKQINKPYCLYRVNQNDQDDQIDKAQAAIPLNDLENIYIGIKLEQLQSDPESADKIIELPDKTINIESMLASKVAMMAADDEFKVQEG